MKFKNWHQSDGWLYPLLEPLCRIWLWPFFKKIYLHNVESVPDDKPVIIAANHPSAFMDPVIFCTHFPGPVYNMTRGDVFKKPALRWLFTQFNMFPVYRVRDGFTSRDRNDAAFDFITNKLKERRLVNIFVEGYHHLDKRIFPLQKGVARAAFGAVERYGIEDLEVLPVGVNYHCGDHPRDVVMLNVGEPIRVKPFFEKSKTAPAPATLELLEAISSQLKKLCFHIENEEDDALAFRLLTLHRSDHPQPVFQLYSTSNAIFQAEKNVLDKLNALPEEQKNELKKNVARWFNWLEDKGLDDVGLRQPWWPRRWEAFLLLTFPLFLMGWLVGFLPFRFGRYIADTKVQKREFYASIYYGSSFVFSLIFFPLLLLLILIFGNLWWVLGVLVLPAIVYFSVIYRDIFKNVAAVWKAKKIVPPAELQRWRDNWMEGLN